MTDYMAELAIRDDIWGAPLSCRFFKSGALTLPGALRKYGRATAASMCRAVYASEARHHACSSSFAANRPRVATEVLVLPESGGRQLASKSRRRSGRASGPRSNGCSGSPPPGDGDPNELLVLPDSEFRPAALALYELGWLEIDLSAARRRGVAFA